MHPATALLVSRALADEHRRRAERGRRDAHQRRVTDVADRPKRWPFRLQRPRPASSGA
jgi:hypothetical protein